MKKLTIKIIKELSTSWNGSDDLENQTVIKWYKECDELYSKYFNKYIEYGKLLEFDKEKYSSNMMGLISNFKYELNYQKGQRNLW